MNLNTFLCKYFKSEDKYYVEVWDIIKSKYTIIYIIIPFFLGLFYFLKNGSIEITDPLVDVEIMRTTGTNDIYLALFMIWFVGFIQIIVIQILYSICKIKVAKCNLEEI